MYYVKDTCHNCWDLTLLLKVLHKCVLFYHVCMYIY